MSGVVVIKFGGGLITDKEQLCTVDEEIVSSLASMLTKVDKKLIIVHGAGSFGHLKSKKYRLSEGRVSGIEQDTAIQEVRDDMMELNSHLMNAFSQNGIHAESFPPHRWASGLGIDFTGELPYSSGLTVVFGDVVPDDNQEFGILSGDDLVVRYALETPEVEHLIFAVAGVDGLLKVPPHLAGPEDLFETWSSDLAPPLRRGARARRRSRGQTWARRGSPRKRHTVGICATGSCVDFGWRHCITERDSAPVQYNGIV